MLSVNTTSKKEVACGIMFYENKVLMGLRSSTGKDPGIWEFPGGKQESGETLHQCLHREWKEELNLDIRIVDELISVNTSGHKCHFYIGFIKKIESLEVIVHDKVRLVDVEKLNELNLFPEDYKILHLLSSYLNQLQR